jgi:predicted phosphohydrolase
MPYFKGNLNFFEENSIKLQNMLKSIYFILKSSTLKFEDENTILGLEGFNQALVYKDCYLEKVLFND